jgi:thiopurine S-methyltransferase
MSKQFWEDRWLNNQTGWDLGQVSPPILNYVDQLTIKASKILIPGCGNAYEAEYLFKHGFKNIFIVEIAKGAIDSFIERCPIFPVENIIHADFFEIEGQFDLIIEQTFFCAINPSLRPDYVEQMANLLKPKGKIAGVMFNREFESGPPFSGSIDEYNKSFGELFNIKTLEECYNSIEPRKGSEVFVIFEKK